MGITANVSGERVQSSGAKSKMADAIDKCVDMEQEIDSLIDMLIEVKREVIQTIEKLESAVEYDVLHMRFIQHKTLEEIADHYGRSYDWVTTTQGRAFVNVQKILNARRGV